MRKRILITVIFILAFLLTTVSTAFAADEQYQIVRVRLSIGDPTEFSFFADGNYTIGVDGAGLERQLYTVKLEAGTLNLYNGSEKVASGASIKLVRHAETAGRNNFIWMYNIRAHNVYEQYSIDNDKFRYLGDMEFVIESGHISAVNHVYIEDYLYGVVPYEMSDSFPAEALKAQAVAARNYVEYHLGGTTYDVVDTSSSQVYNGYMPTNTNSINAVNQTAKTVLTYGGSVIETVFSASNGGYTDIPYHRWGSGEGWAYYQFSEDPFDTANPSSLYETITFPKTFASYDSVTVADNVTGTPDKMKAVACIKQAIFDNTAFKAAHPEVVDRNGFELTGIQSMSAFEYDVNGNEDHNRTPSYAPNTCIDKIMALCTFNITIAGAPVTAADVVLDLRYLDGSLASTNNEFKAFNADSLTLFVVAPVMSGETVTGYSISQKRYGQGIGLSQRGAQQRATSVANGGGGQTYDQILGFYYPGTTLTTQGYTAPTLASATMPDHSNASLTRDVVNVRNGPSTSNSSLNRLPLGARIEVVQANFATTGTIVWHKIYYAGQYAYIAASVGATQYVQLDSPMAREPLTITFQTNGGSAVSAGPFYHADSLGTPASSKTNYTLEGWYSDEALTSRISDSYILTRNMTLYAKWVPKPYSISYDLRGGAATNPTSYTVENGEITLNNPTRNGYTFAGWTGTGLSSATMTVKIPTGSSGNRTYYANWSPISYSITYNLGGGNASNPVNYTIESSNFTLTNPTKLGYAFIGWTGTGLSKVTLSVTIPAGSTGTKEFTANWAPCVCKVDFNAQGGTAVASVLKDLWDTITTEPLTTRDNYYFAGWYTSAGQRISFPYIISNNVTLYAKWTPVAYSINYDLRGGSASNPGSYTIESGAITLRNPTRTGYTFTGWTGTGLSSATMTVTIPAGSTGNKAYSANWSQCVYSVGFDAQGGSPVSGVQKVYGETIASEPATSRYGFSFAGWFTSSGQRVSFPYTVTDNATLYAGWNAQPQTNGLAGVGLSSGSLNRGFASSVTSYKVMLGENDSSFTLTPYKEFDGASMTINGKPYSSYTVSLASGKSATITVKVTLAKKAKTYKFTVTRPKSSNNYLSALSVAGGALNQGFDPNVLNYTLTLDENTKSTTIKAFAAAGKAAKVSPATAKVSLNNGQSKTVRITVKAQSGAKRTYTIQVVRAASSNADLKSLKASGLSPGFSPGNTNYTIVLPANKSTASISASAIGYKSAVYIDGAKKSSKKVTLGNGQSTVVRVTVVSQAGSAKDYLITVIRQ